MSADTLVVSQRDYAVDLLGPTRSDTGWQAREDQGFSLYDFVIDWVTHRATCPAGQSSLHWMPALNSRGKPVIQIKFSS